MRGRGRTVGPISELLQISLALAFQLSAKLAIEEEPAKLRLDGLALRHAQRDSAFHERAQVAGQIDHYDRSPKHQRLRGGKGVHRYEAVGGKQELEKVLSG